MTKNDIVKAVCENCEVPKSTAIHAVDCMMQVLSDALVNGDNVYLRGFGTFVVKTTKEKKARNISKGTVVIVPAQRTVKFKLSKQLKKRINNGTVD